MQSLDSFFRTAIKRGYHLEGIPRVIAEWNYNNLFNVTASNIPDDQNWINNKDYFPISSITTGFRPNTGIFYAFTGDSFTDGGVGLAANRYYTIDTNSIYKYWMCPTPSSVSERGAEFGNNLPMDFAVDRGVVQVDYGQFLNMNKLSVTFGLGPTPTDWKISVFEQISNNWVDISNPTIDAFTGKCEVWWNGTTWLQTQQLDETKYQKISKVKIEVVAIDKPGKRLQVIELAGKREIEITNRTEQYTINESMDNHDFIHPVGSLSANDGSIVIDNSDLKINHDQPTSDFFGLLEGWCQYRTYVQYDLTPYGGSSQYIVRTGTMFSNDWQQENEFQYTVELFDVFKMLQSIDCPPLLLEEQSIGKIISILLDMVGIDTYNFNINDFDTTNIVKYFWTDGKQKVFEVLDSLCQSYQAALFVDEFGVIKLLTRNEITVSQGETAVWNFLGEDDGDDIPDIITLQKQYETITNKIKINYKKRTAKIDEEDITDQPLASSIWEADSTVVLRSSPLTRQLRASLVVPDDGQNDIWVPPEAATTWPFKGKMNIDGELIEYEGKGYIWWDHTSGIPVYTEGKVTNNDERKALDRKSYLSYNSSGTIGGVSSDPEKQNGYSGRLCTKARDLDGTGQAKIHYAAQSYGWYTMDFWTEESHSWGFPGRFFTPGGNTYNLNNLRNWTNRPGWTECQSRVTISNSIATVDNFTNNSAPDHASHATVLVNNMGNTEFRELGTRLRLRGGTNGQGLIAFYMTDANGYDDSGSTLTEVFYADRAYIVNVCTTDWVEAVGRSSTLNEISVQVKNGDDLTTLPAFTVSDAVAGQMELIPDKWYDVDIVFRDGVAPYYTEGSGTETVGTSQIEVFIDGTYMGAWYTDDNIRPTGLIGIGAKDESIVDFEDVYGSTISSRTRKYNDDNLFDAQSLRLDPGTNVTALLNVPVDGDWDGDGVMSFATCVGNATIHEVELSTPSRSKVVQVLGSGGLVLKPDQRWKVQFNDVIAKNTARVKIRYTSSNPISMALEYSSVRNFPYGADTDPIAPSSAYFDLIKGGYLSTKKEDMLMIPQASYTTEFQDSTDIIPKYLNIFYEDFGAVVHEVRDFDVEFSASPAKGTGIYTSNKKSKIIDYHYSPVRGYFTLANASHKDEILNGTEEIDDSNSIDYSLMMYGYVLDDKGDFTETVQNDLSIRRHGIVSQDLDATWIFTEEEAKDLGKWIVDHWGGAMDTVSMTTYSSTFIEIGDKVHIKYSNAAIDSTWFYIVTSKSTSFDNDGLATTITARRVQ